MVGFIFFNKLVTSNAGITDLDCNIFAHYDTPARYGIQR